MEEKLKRKQIIGNLYFWANNELFSLLPPETGTAVIRPNVTNIL